MKFFLLYFVPAMVLCSFNVSGQSRTSHEKRVKKNTKKNINANFPKTNSVAITGDKINTLKVDAKSLKTLKVNGKDIEVPVTDCIDTYPDAILLEFNVNGQLISNPPEQLAPGNQISARVNLNINFWNDRTREAIDSYIEVLEALKSFASTNSTITFGIGNTELKTLEEEISYLIDSYVTRSSLPNALQLYYKNKLVSLGHGSPSKPAKINYFPDLNDLVKPLFTIDYQFYDKNENRIDDDGKLFCYPEPPPDGLSPCCSAVNRSGGFYFSAPKTLPPNVAEVKYNLRLENSLDEVLLAWSGKNSFPSSFRTLLENAKTTIEKDLAGLTVALEEVKKNPSHATLTMARAAYKKADTDIQQFISDLNKNDLLSGGNPNPDSRTNWIMQWLWLTKGVPQINPIASQRIALFEQPKSASGTKVSQVDKAKYSIFESLMNKNAFQLPGIPPLDDIAKIKADMDAEAEAKSKSGTFADAYLYKGLLKSSPANDGSIQMRHHDALTDYIVMNLKPQREIIESQRMFILVENTKPDARLGIGITTEAIASDLSLLTTELLLSERLADVRNPVPDSIVIATNKLKAKVETLNKTIEALKTISKPPILPLALPEDDTPNYVTNLLEHDYFFDAPVVVKYSIKSIAADNTEKELKQSSYRINKLYRVRFKAGLVYSFLKVNDYTQTAPNQFTLSNPTYGIDGTFGIEVYPRRTDIRKSKLWTPYLYAGLSMRKIAENFYLGGGIEPISGLAIGAVAHLGKREALIGSRGIPTGVKQTWGTHVGITVMVDWVLFTKLFGFSTNKSMLGL